MNKLIASLIVGAFSAAAFATSPIPLVATPDAPVPVVAGKAESAQSAKAEAKKMAKEKAAVVKADTMKKVEAKVPAAAALVK